MRRDVYLRKPDASGAAAMPRTPYAVGVPKAEPAAAEPAPAGASRELVLPYRIANEFTPSRRRLARNLVIGTAAPSEVESPYSRLRVQIFRRMQESGWKALAVASPSRSSGATLTAVNLAMNIARHSSQTVVLVELDFAHPSFRRVLGFRQQKGLVDHLLHDVPAPDILLNPGVERLVVVPAGSPAANASELLSSPKLARFMEELKRRCGDPVMVFDLPAAPAIEDAMAFAPFVDCTLLVVEEGGSRVNDIRKALDCLEPLKVLGVALNRSVHVERDGSMSAR